MSDYPRRLLQIHLSTALVLMVLAGGLMWLNVMDRPVFKSGFKIGGKNISSHNLPRVRGWPWSFQTFVKDANRQQALEQSLQANGLGSKGIYAKPLLLNIFVALLILGVTGVGCEWATRRKGKFQAVSRKI